MATDGKIHQSTPVYKVSKQGKQGHKKEEEREEL